MLVLLFAIALPIFVLTFLIVKVLEGFGLKEKDEGRRAQAARIAELEKEIAELRWKLTIFQGEHPLDAPR